MIWEHSQILVNALCWQCRLEMLMLSAVPTGLAILTTVPTDKSVGYFHLSLRDKIPIYKKVGMHPYKPLWLNEAYGDSICSAGVPPALKKQQARRLRYR